MSCGADVLNAVAVAFSVDATQLPKGVVRTPNVGGTQGHRAPYTLPYTITCEALSRLPNEDKYADYNDEYAPLVLCAMGATDPDHRPEVADAVFEFTDRGGYDLDGARRLCAEENPRGDGHDFFRHVARGDPALAAEMRGKAAWAVFPPVDAGEVIAIADAMPPHWLAVMNAKFAIVEQINGVIRFTPDSDQPFQIMSFGHFREVMNGKQKIPTCGKGRPMGLGTAWLGHPDARRYERMGLWLKGEEPLEALNLYRGFPEKSEMEL